MKIYLLLITFLLTACAAGGQLYKEIQQPNLEGKSSVVVFRKKQFADGGSCYTVYVDNKPVGVWGNGGFIRVILAPGEHKISIPHMNGNTLAANANLVANQQAYLEYNSVLTGVNVIPLGTAAIANTSFNFALTPVSEDYADTLLPNLKDSSTKVSCMMALK